MIKSKKISLAVTMGDAAGIGPEIILKTLQDKKLSQKCTLIVIGDEIVLRKTAEKINLSYALKQITPNQIQHAKEHALINLSLFKTLPPSGKPSKLCGKAAIQYLELAVQLAKNNGVSGIVTAPINKEILKLADSPFHGHTEYLASLTKTRKFGMAFTGGGLKLILATIHEPLSKVSGLLTKPRLRSTISLALRACEELGLKHPKIGVAGFNPHAGENGMFGLEEIKTITPIIHEFQKKGCQVIGPVPPDTLFHRALSGEFDFLVTMYHDQALIPLKTLDFHGGVNFTVGLPIIRTSPDHGTAYNLVGKGLANPSSMISAVHLAIEMAQNRKFT